MMTKEHPRITRPLLIGAALCGVLGMVLVGCGKDSAPSGTAQVASAPAKQNQPAPAPAGKQGTPPTGRPVKTVPTPAVQAIYGNDIKRLEALLDAGVNPNEQDENWFSLLHHAAQAGRYEIAEMLIERGADVNIRARLNVTPLLWAVRFNQLDICVLLVENGADVNARGGVDDRITPLSNAVQVNYVDIVDYLRTVGAEM
jgi:ankyrin repeat protein